MPQLRDAVVIAEHAGIANDGKLSDASVDERLLPNGLFVATTAATAESNFSFVGDIGDDKFSESGKRPLDESDVLACFLRKNDHSEGVVIREGRSKEACSELSSVSYRIGNIGMPTFSTLSS
jgi:hypothetical protein